MKKFFKYLHAVLTHRPKFYRGTTDRFCHNLSEKGRRIKIFGFAQGPIMIAFHVLDLTNVKPPVKSKGTNGVGPL